MEIEIKTAKAGDITMRFFHFGKGKRTLVIIPGVSIQSVMLSAQAVARQYEDMARNGDYTIYVIDRREDFPESYSIREMAQDTAEVIRAIGLEKVDIFGASQGGMITLAIAAAYPDLVRKIVVGSTAAYADETRCDVIDRWDELAQKGDGAGLFLAFGEALYPEKIFEKFREYLIACGNRVTEEDLHRFRIQIAAAKGCDLREDLKRITCPVFAIGANDDRIFSPEETKRIADAFAGRKDCRMYMYDDCGHAAFDIAPDYRERMLDFLLA